MFDTLISNNFLDNKIFDSEVHSRIYKVLESSPLISKAFELTLGFTDSNINRGSVNHRSKVIEILKSSDPLIESKSISEIMLHEALHISVREIFKNKNFNISTYPLARQIEQYYDHIQKSLSFDDFKSYFSESDYSNSNQIRSTYDYIFTKNEDQIRKSTQAYQKEGFSYTASRAKAISMDKRIRMQEFVVHSMTNNNINKMIKKQEVDLDTGWETTLANLFSFTMNKAVDEKALFNIVNKLSKNHNGIVSLITGLTENLTKTRSNIDQYIAETPERLLKKTKKEYEKAFDKMYKEEGDIGKFLESDVSKRFARYKNIRTVFTKGIDKVKTKMFDKLYEKDNYYATQTANLLKQIVKPPQDFKDISIYISKTRAKTDLAKYASETRIQNIFNESTDGKYSDKQKEVLTDVFVKTDLLDVVKNHDVKRLFTDAQYLKDRITSIEKTLKSYPIGSVDFMIEEARKLADYNINDNKYKFLYNNGYSIMKATTNEVIDDMLSGGKNKKQMMDLILHKTRELKKLGYHPQGMIAERIDELISLYSIKNARYKHYIMDYEKDMDFIIENVINISKNHRAKFHRTYGEKFTPDNFNRKTIQKGSVSTRYKAKIKKKVIKKSLIDKYKKAGYEVTGEKLFSINNEDYFLMITEDFSEGVFISQAMSSVTESSSNISLKYIAEENGIDFKDLKSVIVDELYSTTDHKKSNSIPMSVIFDKYNDVSSVWFKIPEEIQTGSLRAERKIDTVLGIASGEIEAKIGSYGANKELAKWLVEVNKKHDLNDKTSVLLSNKNRELWRKLPKEIKEEVAKADHKVYIPKVIYDEIMGVSITSLTDTKWFKDYFDKHLVAKSNTDQFMGIVKDVMTIVKGKEVMKTPDVWVSNLVSNFVELNILGLSTDEIAKGYSNLTMMTKDYENYKRELVKLYAKPKATRTTVENDRIIDLESRLDNNIIQWAFNNGFYENIVEDIMNSEVDINRNRITNAVDSLRDKMKIGEKSNIGWVLDEMYMTQNSTLGKASKFILTHGDFFAKILLFQKISKPGMSEKEKLTLMNDINELFINYSKAQSSSLEYANRTGIFIYSKFLFGVPYTLLKTAQRKLFSTSMFYMSENTLDTDVASFDDTFNDFMFSSRFRIESDTVTSALTPIVGDIAADIIKALK